ncbi:MAG TPA: CHC2 zinc finger domain-containing protein [Candidatus Hydrogenedentes bacterium]|nr:CHC2 zinc finger domain-containing protein [Candidatus Hydrogenedentota bacterium]
MNAGAVRNQRRLDAAQVKAAVDPAAFYKHELPGMPPPRRMTGWANAGLCCFHDDHNEGNFRVNLDTGAFCCFACGRRGGDVIAFTQQRRAVSFRDALAALANEWELC